MAVEVEAAGQVDEFLRILRRRIWWIIIPLAVVGSLGTFFAVVVPKKYVVTTRVLVRDANEQAGPLGRNASALEGAVAKINITSSARIDTVLKKLKVEDYIDLSNSEAAEYRVELIKNLRVSTPSMHKDTDQQLVEIRFEHTSADAAVAFVRTLREHWTDDVLLRHLAREETDLRATKDKLAELRKSRDLVSDDLRDLRSDHHIPPRSGNEIIDNRDKPESFKQQEEYNRLIKEREDWIAERLEHLERLEFERDQMPPETPVITRGPASTVDKRLEALDLEIAKYQDDIDRKDYSPTHADYKRLKRKISALKENKLEIQRTAKRDTFETLTFAPNKVRSELELRIEKMKVELRQWERQRATYVERESVLDDQNLQMQDALAMEAVLEADEKNLNEGIRIHQNKVNALELKVRRLSSKEGNPFEILDKAIRPTKPTSPNPWVISIGSILFGLALGFGLAILKEYSKSCFRSARELNRVMTHPVLGTVNAIRTRRERARDFLLRSVLGGGSLLFVASVGYVTWAWGTESDTLTEPLVQAINDFRDFLK